jgi:uncharacterized DUF497 family protein
MFEWDDAKRKRNLAKHGVDFAEIEDFNWADAVRFVDERQDYGEVRFVALGYLNDRLYVCVYTQRGHHYRIISLRKANRREEDIYEDETLDE